MNYLPRLALNHDPPDLCLPSSWDYRCEPLVQCIGLIGNKSDSGPVTCVCLQSQHSGVCDRGISSSRSAWAM
jgi:hypothetical protein